MAEKTGIEWADATWNPITGCSRVSPGCLNCFAERLTATRLRHQPKYQGLTDAKGHWTGEVRCHPELLDQPMRWREPRRIFVDSMSDTFHERVPWAFIVSMFEVMVSCPQHEFHLLTKRPGRMAFFGNVVYPRYLRGYDITDTALRRMGMGNYALQNLYPRGWPPQRLGWHVGGVPGVRATPEVPVARASKGPVCEL